MVPPHQQKSKSFQNVPLMDEEMKVPVRQRSFRLLRDKSVVLVDEEEDSDGISSIGSHKVTRNFTVK